jgi:CheY-like chemotaxis protein
MTSTATLSGHQPTRLETSSICSTPPTILIVEDDLLLLELASLLLAEQGYEILQARSARQALEILAEQQEPPRLFLLDHDLGPGMTGLELFDQLRAQPAYQDIPAMMASALLPPCEELEQRSITALQKPYDIDQFVNLVEAVLVAHYKTLV